VTFGPARQTSLTNSECVRKFEPRVGFRIGFHWMSVLLPTLFHTG
jgi:hypothetical protein